MKTAIQMIDDERMRQIKVKGYTSEHDDLHTSMELAVAAACYAAPVPIYSIEFCGDGDTHDMWPWGDESKETAADLPDMRRLVIAGALIVAEIERLQRADQVRGESK